MRGTMAMSWPPVGARLKLEPWPVRYLPIRSPGARSRRRRSRSSKRSPRRHFAGCRRNSARCARGLVIRVEDFPTEEVLDELGAQSEFDLLGLFQGVGLPFRSESTPGQMPNMVWLYRRPILDYWAEHDEALGAIITHVLVHEIGHHFGLSDDDMAAIEATAG